MLGVGYWVLGVVGRRIWFVVVGLYGVEAGWGWWRLGNLWFRLTQVGVVGLDFWVEGWGGVGGISGEVVVDTYCAVGIMISDGMFDCGTV